MIWYKQQLNDYKILWHLNNIYIDNMVKLSDRLQRLILTQFQGIDQWWDDRLVSD